MALDTTQYATTVLGRGDVPITTYAPNTTLGYSNDTIAAIPGLSDAINGRNGNQTLQNAMANPTQWVEQNHLFNALGNGDQGKIDESLKFLSSQGVDANTIQNDLTNYANYIQQSSSSGMFGNSFIGNVLNTVTSPENIAALMANAIVPGSGALVKTIEDISGGKQNLTNDLVSMAVSAYNPSESVSQNVTNTLSNYVPSEIAKDVTAGALTTAANLAQGQNLQNSLVSGTVGAINTGLGDSMASLNPPTPNTPAPVVDLSTAPPSGLPPEGGLTQINSGNGLGDTLPMSPSSGTSFDPTAPQDINSISQSVTSGSTDPTAQATTGLPPIDTTQPSLNDITQQVAPTDASGNPALTSQILPSATDIVSRVDNFNGTSTVTYKDGTTAIVDTPNSAPNYNPTTGTTNSGNATNNPTSSPTSSPLSSVGSNSSSGSSSQSPPLGSSAYNPLAATILSTGTVLNRSPLQQALGASEATLEPSQLDQLNSQNTNPYMPQNISEGSPDIKFAKDGGSMGGLGRYEHKPEFVTGHTGYYAQGGGTGQSDDIPALLKDGDYVMDADIVAALGDGSNKAGAEALHHFMGQFPHKHYENHSTGGHINAMIADGEFVFPSSLVTALGGGSNKEGAKKLDDMREKIREHKRSASTNKIPPKAKSPLSYMEKK